MIALVIAIAVFRFFQKLAVKHQKIHWQIGLLGMLSFLFVQYVSVYLFKLVIQENSAYSVILYSFFGWAVSSVIIFFLYKFLNQYWRQKGKKKIESEIDEIGYKF